MSKHTATIAGERTQLTKDQKQVHRRTGVLMDNKPTSGFPILKVLQEMADCSQQAGMLPDAINAVCDSFSELLALVKEYAEHADCGDGGEHADNAQGFTPKAGCWHCRSIELVEKIENRS